MKLEKIFGDAPLIRVLDFLLENQNFDFTKKEISQHAKVNFKTLNKILPKLEDNEIILPTRRIGKAILYKLNINSEIVKIILEFKKKGDIGW